MGSERTAKHAALFKSGDPKEKPGKIKKEQAVRLAQNQQKVLPQSQGENVFKKGHVHNYIVNTAWKLVA